MVLVRQFLTNTTPSARSEVASQFYLIVHPPLIVFKESFLLCVRYRRRACGKCGKAERP